MTPTDRQTDRQTDIAISRAPMELKIVKSAAMKETIKYLSNLKIKHSKLDDISFSELKPQKYLFDSRLNLHEMKLLFELRTRMFNCKENFKNNYKNESFLHCQLCLVALDNQSHLLNCFVLKNSIPELRDNANIVYKDLFGSIDKQVKFVKLISKVIKTRSILLEKLSP